LPAATSAATISRMKSWGGAGGAVTLSSGIETSRLHHPTKDRGFGRNVRANV
jgi:hypothetical protein